MGNNRMDAILALKMMIDADPSQISKEALQIKQKVEDRIGSIELSADNEKVIQAFQEISKYSAKFKNVGMDLTKIYSKIFEAFADPNKSMFDILEVINSVQSKLETLNKLEGYQLNMMQGFTAKQVDAVLAKYGQVTDILEEQGKLVEKQNKETDELFKTLANIDKFETRKFSASSRFTAGGKYKEAISDDAVASLGKQLNVDTSDKHIYKDVQEYSKLIYILKVLNEEKKEYEGDLSLENKFAHLRALKEEYSIYKQIEIIRSKIAKTKNVKSDEITAGLPEWYKIPELGDPVKVLDKYKPLELAKFTKKIKEAKILLDKYIEEAFEEVKRKTEQRAEDVKSVFQTKKATKSSGAGSSGTDGSSDESSSGQTGVTTAGASIENVSNKSKEASDNVENLQENLQKVGKGSGEGLDLWTESAKVLKDEFGDLIKYAVSAEEAFAKITELYKKFRKEGALDKSELIDIVSYSDRISALDMEGLVDRTAFISDESELSEDLDGWAEKYGKNIDAIYDMTNKQIKEIEHLKLSQKDAVKETKENANAQRELEEKAGDAERQMRKGASLSAESYEELLGVLKSVSERFESLSDASFLNSSSEELKQLFSSIVSNFGEDLTQTIKDFTESLEKAGKADYGTFFDSIRDKFILIVQEFQRSLDNINFSGKGTNEIYNLIRQWNEASQILKTHGQIDSERTALLNTAKGSVSNAYLYDKEGSFSARMIDSLSDVSKGISNKVGEVFDTWLHSHPIQKSINGKSAIGADIGFSPADIDVLKNRFFDQDLFKMMVTSNGKYASIDWNGISKEIIAEVVRLFRQSDIFASNGQFKESLAIVDGKYSFDKQSELLNGAIIDSMTKAGIEDAQSRFKTGDISELNVDLEKLKVEEKEATKQAEEFLEILSQISTVLGRFDTEAFKFEGLDKLIDDLQEVKQLIAESKKVDLNIDKLTWNSDSDAKIKEEIDNIELLKNKILEVTTAINSKTNAFKEEGEVVFETVQKEISSLESLNNKLSDIIESLQKISEPIKLNIDLSSIENIDKVKNNKNQSIDDLKVGLEGLQIETLKQLAGAFKSLDVPDGIHSKISALARSIKKLKEQLLTNIDPNDFAFLESIKELITQADKLRDLAIVLKASKKQMENAKNTINQQNGIATPAAAPTNVFDVAINSDEWNKAIGRAQNYKDIIGEIEKITYRFRRDEDDGSFYKSFSFVGTKGKATEGKNGELLFGNEDKKMDVVSGNTSEELDKLITKFEKAAEKSKLLYDITSLKIDDDGIIIFTTTVEELGNQATITKYKINDLANALNSDGSLNLDYLNSHVVDKQIKIPKMLDDEMGIYEELLTEKMDELTKNGFLFQGATFKNATVNDTTGKATITFLEIIDDKAREITVRLKDVRKALDDIESGNFDWDSVNAKQSDWRQVKVSDILGDDATSDDPNRIQLKINAYKSLISSEEEYQKLRAKVDTKTATDKEIERFTALKYLRESYNNLINETLKLTKAEDAFYKAYGEKQLEKLKQQYAEKKSSAGNIYDAYTTDVYKNNLNSYISDAEETFSKLKGGDFTSSYMEELSEIETKIKRLKSYTNPINIIDQNDILEIEKIKEEIDAIFQKSKSGSSIFIDSKQAYKLEADVFNIINRNSGMLPEVKKRFEAIGDELASYKGKIPADRFKELAEQVQNARVELERSNKVGKTFLGKVKDKIVYGWASFVARYFSLYDFIRYARKIYNEVKTYDKALTEMRKVSDETISTLKEFQKESFKTAEAVGTTAEQLQNSTADWMRLGETLEEAKESAEVSNILLNVSEFENIDAATESLVAMSSAFKDLEKIDIVDKLNEVGNNYAISTDGLATALQNSASALVTAGNDIDEAIALTTAGNAVTQDPDKVGTGLRTIALRITGTKDAKAQLEELGESTEDFVIRTTAKSQELIKDFTRVASNEYKGFDILDENGNFKSTYEILLGIAEIYEEILETDEKNGSNMANGLLETLAGKNRANIAASILQNPQILKDSYESSQNSENSAQDELQKYLDSLEGHVSKFNNALDKLILDFASSDLIKNVVDFGTAVIKATDGLVNLGKPLGSVSAILGAILGFRNEGLVKVNTGASLNNNFKSNIGSYFTEKTVPIISQQDINRLILYNEEIEKGTPHTQAFDKTLFAASKTAKQYAINANGVAVNISAIPKVTKAASLSIKMFSMALNSIIYLAIGRVISEFINAIKNWINAAEIAKEAAVEFGEKLENLQKEQKDNKKTISELEEEYQKLSNKVGLNGENLKLTTEEYKRYHDITNQISSIMPNLIQGYDDQGNAILKLKGNLVDLNAEYEKSKQNEALELYNEKDEKGRKFKRENIYTNSENVLFGDKTGLFRGTFKSRKEYAYENLLSTDEKINYLNDLYKLNFKDAKSYLSSNSDYISQLILRYFDFNENTTQKDFNKIYENIKKEISLLQNEIETSMLQIGQSGLTYAMTTDGYYALDDNQKTYLSSILNNLTSDFVKANGFYGKDGDKNVESFVSSLIENLDTTDVKNALEDLYNLDMEKVATDDVEEYLETIAKLLNVDSDILYNAFGFSAYDNQLKNVKAKVVADDKHKVDSLSLADLEIANGLEIPDNTLMSWDSLLQKINEYKESTNKGFSKSEMIDSINSMTDGFDVLDQIYADVYDKESFDFTKLDTKKFAESFEDLDEEYDAFIETVSTSPDNIDACQEAFNNLVTAFIDNKGILKEVTDENVELTKAMLKNMGVANADEVAYYALEQAKAKEYVQSQNNLTVTSSNIASLINEANSAGIATNAYLELTAKEILFNNNEISTASKCAQILEIANAAGVAAISLSSLNAEIANVAGQKIGSGARKSYAESKGIKVITEKERADGLKKGSLYVVNGKEFEEFEDAIYYAEAYNTSQKISDAYAQYKPEINYTGGDATKSAKDAAADAAEKAKEDFDYFERRVKNLENAFTSLEQSIENVIGSFAKNKLLDAQLDILDQEFSDYTKAIDMYQSKANEYLSKIPSDIRDKIVNGHISIQELSDEDVKEAISDYETWADKVVECTQKLEELKTQLRELELQKFNNIVEDFTNQFDLFGNSNDLIEGQISLLEESGELIGRGYYNSQIDLAGKQLKTLEEQKAAMVNQIAESINSGRIQKGTDEWLEMQKALVDVENSILDCKTSIEQYENAILELDWQNFERMNTEFGNLSEELSGLVELLNDFNDIEVSDGKGNWTNKAITALGLYTQQYEIAKYQVGEYAEQLRKLEDDYRAGKYSTVEYTEKLAELKQGQMDAVNAAESMEDAIIELNEKRINEEIESINEEIEAYKEVVDAQLEAIETSEKLADRQEDLADKSKSVADIEKKLAAIQNDTTAAAIAERKQLEEELYNAKKELSDAEHDYSIEDQKDALNKQYENYEEEKNDEIEALEESLKERERILTESFETVKNNAALIGQEILLLAQDHGIKVSNSITTAWANGENAIASYGEVLSVKTSAFVGNLNQIQAGIYGLQIKADEASVSIANMFEQRADLLVQQLKDAYDSEVNLQNMSNALAEGLNNLSKGFDNMASSAGNAAKEVNNLKNALNNPGDSSSSKEKIKFNVPQPYGKNNPYQSAEEHAWNTGKAANGSPSYYKVVTRDTHDEVAKGFSTREEAEEYINKYGIGGRYKVMAYKAYRKGSKRIDEDQLAWTDEYGQREMIIRRSDGAILTRLEKGDAVANANLAENLFKWGAINPNSFMQSIGNMGAYKVVDIQPNESQRNVVLNIGKLNEFNGDFNGTEQLLGMMNKVATNNTTKILNEIDRSFRVSKR